MTGTWATGWATGDIVTAAEFKKTAGSVFDTTLGGSAASIDVTSISGTYAHLLMTIYARGDTAATLTQMLIRFNGDSGANYDYQALEGSAATASAGEAFGQAQIAVGVIPANTAAANLFGGIQVFVPHYAGSTNNKSAVAIITNKIGVATTNIRTTAVGGFWRSNAAINRVTFLPAAGNLVAGTRVTIHALGA